MSPGKSGEVQGFYRHASDDEMFGSQVERHGHVAAKGAQLVPRHSSLQQPGGNMGMMKWVKIGGNIGTLGSLLKTEIV